MERAARVTAEDIGKRRMTSRIGYQVADLFVDIESISGGGSWAT